MVISLEKSESANEQITSPENVEQLNVNPEDIKNEQEVAAETIVLIQNESEITQSIQNEVSTIESAVTLENQSTHAEIATELNLNTELNNFVTETEKVKQEAEQKIKEILANDVTSQKYEGVIQEIKQEKLDWVQSDEFKRRIKLKGATDEDVIQVQNWVTNNINEGGVKVLPPDQFKKFADSLGELTGEKDQINQGSAVYVSGSRNDVPPEIRDSAYITEITTPPMPPLPGNVVVAPVKTDLEKTSETISHEVGHLAQDGLLHSELYQDWKPKMKASAPDPEYVGLIQETDTRVRSMYRELGETFNPQSEVFGQKQLAVLKERAARGEISKDTKDLFDHYDDAEIIKIANRLPAI